MENLKNLEKIAKIFQPQNIITSDEIDQVLKGIMEILASYKKGTDAINEETKAVVNILLDKVVQSNKATLDKAETVLDDRMGELETLLKDVKQMITDVEVLASNVKDGKDADEEKIVEDVVSRIKLEPTIVTLSAEEVRDRLSSLKDDARLDKSAIKGLDKVLQQSDLDYAIATLQQQTSFLINRGGVKSLTAGTNITITDNGGGDYTIASSGGGTPGGSDTQVQFNDGGSFGGDAGLTFNKTTNALSIAGDLTVDTDVLDVDTTNNRIGILTAAPTHSLTLGSTGNGMIIYGTADQTTNYERIFLRWNGTTGQVGTEAGGSGTVRTMQIASGSSSIGITNAQSSSGYFTFSRGLTTAGSVQTVFSGSNTQSSGTGVLLSLTPTINQSSTAGYTALLVNPTETTTGSGTKNLLQLQVGGTNRFRVDNTGNTVLSSTATSGLQVFNTSDETTNYDKFQAKWSSNVFYLSNTAGGTGSARAIRLGTVAAAGTDLPVNYLEVSHSSSGGIFKLISGSFGGSDFLKTTTTVTSSSTIQNIFNIAFTANQSSTGGYTGLLVNATETATGSGTKLLADFQVGGSSKASISNAGLVTAPQIVNTPATITVTTNAGTVTRANRINNFTNSSAAAMTITMSTTSAADGDIVMVRIKDFSAVAQTITWVNTENSSVSVPATSNGSTTLPLTVGFQYNSATSKWRCMMNV